MPKRQSGNKKGKQSNFAKLSIFQPNKYKFKKTCPLSVKGAPEVDYKNIKLLKKYVSENGKILPSRITNVSLKKQRELFSKGISEKSVQKIINLCESFSGQLHTLDSYYKDLLIKQKKRNKQKQIK